MDDNSIRDRRNGGWFWINKAIVDEYGVRIGVHGIAIYSALAAITDEEIQQYNQMVEEEAWRPKEDYARTSREGAKPGFVSVMPCGTSYKIGCTRSPKQRLKAFGVKAPHDVVVHILIPTDDIMRTEWELHECFKHKRQKGEWFLLTKNDLAAIRKAYSRADPSQVLAD